MYEHQDPEISSFSPYEKVFETKWDIGLDGVKFSPFGLQFTMVGVVFQ